MKIKIYLRNYLLAAFFAGVVGGTGLTVVSPQPVQAAPNCDSRLLTFPTWYRNLTDPATCDIKSPSSVEGGINGFIYILILNVVEIMLQAVGYIAVIFVIIGGFQYMTSLGSPGGMVSARKTIFNAIVGLVISFFAVAVVNVVAGAV